MKAAWGEEGSSQVFKKERTSVEFVDSERRKEVGISRRKASSE